MTLIKKLLQTFNEKHYHLAAECICLTYLSPTEIANTTSNRSSHHKQRQCISFYCCFALEFVNIHMISIWSFLFKNIGKIKKNAKHDKNNRRKTFL